MISAANKFFAKVKKEGFLNACLNVIHFLLFNGKRSLRYIKNYGVFVFLKKMFLYITNEYIFSRRRKAKWKKDLTKVIQGFSGSRIIILKDIICWNVPLFQRPQQLATELSGDDVLYLFCTPNYPHDNIKEIQKIGHNAFLITGFKEASDLMMKLSGDKEKTIHLYSTDIHDTYESVERFQKNGFSILYEYVDEISADISGTNIPQHCYDRHEKIKSNQDIFFVATADVLYQEVRGRQNAKLVTNGVDVNHFSKGLSSELPADIRQLIDVSRPVIGYYGALASWFDYDMIKYAANKRPDWQFLLMGVKYDNSFDSSSIEKIENIKFIGPIDYKVLPQYAQFFDVSTITFKLNDVTESTSPIKLFEYMALGKPIVSTNMPECRKYDSVLIAKDNNDFVNQVEKALSLRQDQAYLNILEKEANKNSWKSKADDILELLQSK